MKQIKNKIITGISVTALLFVSALKGKAQDVEFGVRLMPTVSSFQMQSSSGNTIAGQANLGYGVGAFVGINFTNHIGIQGEVIYNSISQKYAEQGDNGQVNLKYVNVPLLFSLNTNKSKEVNLNVVAGPQVGINVGSSLITSGGNDAGNTQAVLAVKTGDLGVAYGAGLDFGLMSHVRLGIGFRGVYGLINVGNDNTNTATNSYYILDRSYIKTYSAYIGLSFIL
jgi:hypothetical protein